MKISSDAWEPKGIPSLEDGANDAVRSVQNTFIIAGPGAGKTEALAQRAAFLLDTRSCPPPRNILAISFKRDAAKNLHARVLKRCGTELARRFHSYTFDGFAKGIVDRFRLALPLYWRPEAAYKIHLENRFVDLQAFIRSLKPPSEVGTQRELGAIDPSIFHNKFLVGKALDLEPQPARNVFEWAALELWKYRLHQVVGSELTFPMIARLAELILRANTSVLTAVRQSYSHVLLDEFQDTTNLQYDLIKTAFVNTDIALTAVGDHKQRIMGFAMALKNAFEPFKRDFDARQIKLTVNHRSAPELVKIQQRLMAAIDPESAEAVPSEAASALKGSCEVWMFPSEDLEAIEIAKHVKSLLTKGVAPREIAVLVKHSADKYTRALIAKLQKEGMSCRVENELQDLLAEPLVELILGTLRSALEMQNAQLWNERVEFLAGLRGFDSGHLYLRAERELRAFDRDVSQQLTQVNSQAGLAKVVTFAAEYFGKDKLRLHFNQYQQGNRLEELLDQLVGRLWACYDPTKGWLAALNELEGLHSIPIMTIHKSKGLEYHTVIFLGLEDSSFWTFTQQQEDDTKAFFVAFSRAKVSVMFTFAAVRSVNTNYPNQARTKVKPLYQLLAEAGVKDRKFGMQ